MKEYSDNVIIRDLLASLTNEEINVIAAKFKKKWNFEDEHGFFYTKSQYGKKVNAYSVPRFACRITAQVNEYLSLQPDKFNQDEFELKKFNEIGDVLYIYEMLAFYDDGNYQKKFELYGSYCRDFEMIPYNGNMSKIIFCPLAKSSLNTYGRINCLFAFLYAMSKKYGFTYDEIIKTKEEEEKEKEERKSLVKTDISTFDSTFDREFSVYCNEIKKKFTFKNYHEYEVFLGTKEGRIFMKQSIKEIETENEFNKKSLWNILHNK